MIAGLVGRVCRFQIWCIKIVNLGGPYRFNFYVYDRLCSLELSDMESQKVRKVVLCDIVSGSLKLRFSTSIVPHGPVDDNNENSYHFLPPPMALKY